MKRKASPSRSMHSFIGDLFVIRVAGNVMDDHQLGSIESERGDRYKNPKAKTKKAN